MKNFFQLKKLLLFAGDVFVLYLSLYVTLAIRYREIPDAGLWETHFWPFTLIFAAWIFVFYISNLYNLHLAINDARFFSLTNRALIISILAALAFFYSVPDINIAPKTNLLIYIFIFYVLFFLWRRTFNVLLKNYLPKRNIAIIGIDEQVKKLAAELKAKPHLGYVVSFVVEERPELRNGIADLPVVNSIARLPVLIRENRIETIVLNSDPHQSMALRSALFDCLHLQITYLSLPNFYENITGKVPIESINQMWFLENLSEGAKAWFDTFKRIYDVILASILLVLTLVFWPLIALAIKLESRGPAFFIQTRSGKNNQPFLLYKFRTMKEEGNDRSLTTSGDSRITRIGNLLRKTRLDELPQLLNILKGEMSFVGPRPERPEYVSELTKTIPFYKERMLVNPGLTGWDQISGEYHSPSREDSIKKLQYDLYYIKNRSIYLDLSIILKTIMTVLSRGGR